jgi:hypothetical protein
LHSTGFIGLEQSTTAITDLDLLSMSALSITASRFLELERKAERSGPDKLLFNRLLADLSSMPETQERLALEFADLALRSLEGEGDTQRLIAVGIRFSGAIGKRKAPAYLRSIEGVILGSFGLMVRESGSGVRLKRLRFGLRLALTALRRMDEIRFREVLRDLRKASAEVGQDRRHVSLAGIDKSQVERQRKLRELSAALALKRTTQERRLLSHTN